MDTSGMPNRLRAVREIAGVSKGGLSEAAGLDRSHVRRIEDNERPDPAVSTVGALARALDVQVDWLAFGEGPIFQDSALDLDNERDHSAIAERITAAVARARASQQLAATGTEG